MPERLTPEELQEIEARCNAATPGPWVHTPGVALKDYVSSANEDLQFSLQQLHWRDGRESNATNNAEFIANARADIPALLAEIKALKQERDAARQMAALEALKIVGDSMLMRWEMSNEDKDVDTHKYNRTRAHESSSLQDQIIQHFGLPPTARISPKETNDSASTPKA